MSNFLTELGATWFKGSNYLQSFGSKIGFHQVSLSGLANAVDSLKGDEQSVAQITSSF
jgi:hypothetical protein